MRLQKMHWVGIIAGAVILSLDLLFFLSKEESSLFLFLIGITLAVVVSPFVIGITLENKKEQEISEMFLEFSRNLAESVATGTPISKSIINMSKKSYGALNPHVQKLANQIGLGIPVNRSLQNFASDINNPVVSRAIALIGEAERAGGEIDYILESTAKSISEVENLKKERKAAISSLVVQGYIIFFIFIGIMLVMEFKILPLTSGLGGVFTANGNVQTFSDNLNIAPALSTEQLARPFLYLLLVQGLFAGLTIGKLAEGSLRAGIKHSFIMTITAFLITTGANLVPNLFNWI